MRLILLLSLAFIFGIAGCDQNNGITEINSPASHNSSLPHLYTDNTGTVFMSWVEEIDDIAYLKFASFSGDSWTEPKTIASDSTWFINWADYPSIIAQDGTPMAAHWLNKVEGGTYAYHINMATYDNDWSPAFTPHHDDTPTEHGFVSMAPATDSTYAAIWLDGRHTHDRADDEYSDLNKAMTLRGAIIGTDTQILEKFLIDDSVCDCCNTSIVKTDRGFIAAYRNRTADEIRDIYVSSFVDGSWSDPKPVHNDNWQIAACPVNGPSIDAYNETVATAWFTGANGKAEVKLAISEDYGQTFNSPITLDEQNATGRVDLNMTEDKIWVSWLRSNEENAELVIRNYDLNGMMQKEYSIAGLSKSRSSGFPQVTVYEDRLVISFTDLSNTDPTVKMLFLD